MNGADRLLRPSSVRLRPTDAGRALLAASAASLFLAWFGAGVVFSAASAVGAGVFVAALAGARRRAAGLRVVAPEPATAWAREPFVLDVPVANVRRRGSAFDVLLALRGPKGERTRIGALVPEVAAGTCVRVAATAPPLRRGRHPQGTLELESAFPLGLVACRLTFELPHDVLVLPRLGSVRRIDGRAARERAHEVQGLAGRGDEQEVHGLRDWREGESLRGVHWKLSARRGRLLVREFRGEPRPPVHVVLVTVPGPRVANVHGRFEHAVSLAATLVEHHLRRGHPVRLTIAGADARTIACRRGFGGLVPVLRALAEVQTERGVAAPPAPALRPGERTFVVRVGASGTEWPVPRTGSLRVLDLAERRTAAVFQAARRAGVSRLQETAR